MNDNYLFDYLLESNIITPNFIHSLRMKILVYFKSIKSIDILCDINKLKIEVNLQFKWYKIFGRNKITNKIKNYIDFCLPMGREICLEKMGQVQVKDKKYEVIIKYVR